MTLVLALLGQLCFSSACPGSHTLRTKSGECECEPDFPLGDPYSETGCFTCDLPCHSGEMCVAMNTCSCKPGFIRSPSGCTPFFPRPIAVFPHSGTFQGGYHVTILLETTTNATQVFCRFGDVIIAGSLQNSTIIRCRAPPGRVGTCELRVSSDSNDWNLPGATFTYVSDASQTLRRWVLEAVAVTGILAAVAFLLWRPSDADDLQPLIQGVPNAADSLTMQGFYPL